MDSAAMAERYQRSRGPSRRARMVLGGAGIVALTGAVAWVGLYQANPVIQSAIVNYRVVSDHSVYVDFQIVKPAAKAATCTLRARDIAGNEVGREDVVVAADPGGPRSTSVEHTLRTSGKAVVGEVLQCVLNS